MAAHTLTLRGSSQAGPRMTLTAKHHTWYVDEPSDFGGEDTAPSPVEMLLGAFAGCISAAGSFIAREMEIKLQSLDVVVEGDIDARVFKGDFDGGRSGFHFIRASIQAEADWSVDVRNEWLWKVKRRCPVLDNLLVPTEVIIDLK